MDIKEFKNLTKNINEYSADEVDMFNFMTDEELEQYQYDLDCDTGNLSNWDDVRAFYTLKNKAERYEKALEQISQIGYSDKFGGGWTYTGEYHARCMKIAMETLKKSY